MLRPSSWSDAVRLRSQHPDAAPICGGTDLMVDINFGRARPGGLLDLSRVEGLDSWELIDGGRTVRIGAGTSFARIIDELGQLCPALAQAARTVGSPQIRNRGTVAGNLATASPAGDAHPVLLSCWAQIEVESVRTARLIDIDDFFVGPKRSALAPDELIRAVRIPAASGPQQFSKIGPRNAMVIATASFALNLDAAGQRVGTGIGSAGPTPLRARAAEQMLEAELARPWAVMPGSGRPVSATNKSGNPKEALADADASSRLNEDAARQFGALVAEAASPIDDVRGSAAYRRHALSVLARRTLSWALAELPEAELASLPDRPVSAAKSGNPGSGAA